MATFTASAAAVGTAYIYNANGTTSRVVRYTHPIALSAGDVIQMVRIANGTVVTNVRFGCSASAGAITVNCGDGNDTSAYAAAVVLSGSVVSVTMPARGIGRSYSAEDTIDLVVTALSAVPGTVDLFLAIDYTAQNGG